MYIDGIMLIWILVFHFIGDFILQDRETATNKSSSNYFLIKHGIIYFIPLIIFGVYFALINAILHIMVDYVTSRVGKYYYLKNNLHMFFIVIGFDQLLHVICLILTYTYFKG